MAKNKKVVSKKKKILDGEALLAAVYKLMDSKGCELKKASASFYQR